MKKRLEGIIVIILVALVITGIALSWELTLVAGGILAGGVLGFCFGYYHRQQEEIKDRKEKGPH